MFSQPTKVFPFFTILCMVISCSVIEADDFTVPSEQFPAGEEREYRIGRIIGAEYDINPVVTKTVIEDATGGSDVNIHIYEHDGAYLGTWSGASTTSIRLNTSKKYDYYLETGYVKSTIDGSTAFPATNSTTMRNAIYQGDAFRSSTWTSYPTSGKGRFYNATAGEYGGKIPAASSYLNMTPAELDAADGHTDGVFNLEVERLFAKINLNIRISKDLADEMRAGNGSIKVKDVYLVNIPRICNMFQDPNEILSDNFRGWSSIYGWNSSAENSKFIKFPEIGDSVLLPTPHTIDRSYSCTLYAPENLTGEDDVFGDSLSDEGIDGDLGKSRSYTTKAECATRIVVVMEYDNGIDSRGSVTYTYWPGLSQSDFSIIRNTQYNVTLTFTSDGFDITDDWRVDTSSWNIENTEINWENMTTTTLWTNQSVDELYHTDGPSLDYVWCGVKITQLSGTPVSTGGGLKEDDDVDADGLHYAITCSNPDINYDEGYVTFEAYDPEYNDDHSNYRAYTSNWTDQTFRVAFESSYKFITTAGDNAKNITVKHAYIKIGNTLYNELNEDLPSGTWSYDSSTRTFSVRSSAYQEFEDCMHLNLEYKGPYTPKLHSVFYGEWSSDFPEEDGVVCLDYDGGAIGSRAFREIEIHDEDLALSTSSRYVDIYAYIGTDFAHALVYDKVRYSVSSGDDYAEFFGRTTYSIYQGQGVDVDIDYYDEDDNFYGIAWSSGDLYHDTNSWKFFIDGNRISDGMTWKGITFTYDTHDTDEDESWYVSAGASAIPGTYTLMTRTANGAVRYATLRIKAAGGSVVGGSDEEYEQENNY